MAIQGKKGNKKYVFGTDKEHERDAWVEKLTKAAANAWNLPPPPPSALNNSVDASGLSSSMNPLQISEAMKSGGDGDEDDEVQPSTISGQDGIALTSVRPTSESRLSTVPQELCGYLQKKSPAIMKGWQKRYFKTLPSGDINYYKSVRASSSVISISHFPALLLSLTLSHYLSQQEDSNNNSSEEKGQIRLKDIISPGGIELNENTFEFTIKTQTKKIQLRAKDLEEAMEWVKNIELWISAKYSNASID